MNKHLITNDERLTIEESLDFGCEYMHQLSAHQQETVKNNRIAEKLFAEQDRRLKTQNKYIARQLPGNNNDERWICLKAHFQNNKANPMNLLMGSTSGIHGSYTTLNELADEETFSKEYEFDRSHDEAFTIIIIQPRVVRLTYGTIGIRNDEDIEYLRNLISQSVQIIAETQKGNV